MANYRYGGYQYETSPRKLEPDYQPRKNPYAKKKKSMALNQPKDNKQNANYISKEKIKSRIKVVMCIGVVFAGLFVISYRNSLINESFNKNVELKAALEASQKENEQLQVSIENSLNLSNIEKVAKEKLGMQKLEESQKVYVSLPKKDYVEPAVEEVVINDNTSWFQKILNFFQQ